jgi:hypothetical protein
MTLWLAVLVVSSPLWAAVTFDPSMIFWTAPTENEDGTVLTDLAGHVLSCSLISEDYSAPIFTFDVADESAATLMISSLPTANGQRYFCKMQAYNQFYEQFGTAGISGFSGEIEWEMTGGGASVKTPKAPTVLGVS